MPSPDHLAVLLTPLLIGLMLAEWLVACVLGRRVHGGRQTLNNLAVAVGQRVVNSAVGLAPLAGYPWLQEHLGLLRWSPSEAWHWGAAFFAVDLAFYVRHRLAHRVAWLWAMHAVHHQSTEYNFTVATRLSWVQEALLFAVPLAILGLPLEMLLPLFVLGNLWQFVQHTELVGTLGVLDAVLMTPSNHRVHHGCNPRYLDKNYGNILVIWDRLLGTWEREVEPVIYGTLDGLPTYDALENNLRPMIRLLRKAWSAPSWGGALRCLVAPPGWVPGRG
ncbi:MAG TPA: fatty acid hydroxylase family protein, partial [Deltaproteobacteria bacterium]|nr:fatty acid hydroxylase family protein [Deltaproteobacteria bacterium]